MTQNSDNDSLMRMLPSKPSEQSLRRQILEYGTLAALSFGATLGCSREGEPVAKPTKEKPVPTVVEKEVVERDPAEAKALKLLNEAIGKIESNGYSKVTRLDPDKPLRDPLFIIGYAHTYPMSPPTQYQSELLHRAYMSALILEEHGLKRFGVEGSRSNEHIGTVEIFNRKSQSEDEARAMIFQPSELDSPEPDSAEWDRLTPSTLKLVLHSEYNFSHVIAEFWKRSGSDQIGTLLRGSFDEGTTIVGIEDPIKSKAINRWAYEKVLPNISFQDKLFEFLAEGNTFGPHLICKDKRGRPCVSLGEEMIPFDEFRRKLEFHATDQISEHPLQRERERYLLSLPIDVAFIGSDHLPCMHEHQTDRSLFLVEPVGVAQHVMENKATIEVSRQLLRYLDNVK